MRLGFFVELKCKKWLFGIFLIAQLFVQYYWLLYCNQRVVKQLTAKYIQLTSEEHRLQKRIRQLKKEKIMLVEEKTINVRVNKKTTELAKQLAKMIHIDSVQQFSENDFATILADGGFSDIFRLLIFLSMQRGIQLICILIEKSDQPSKPALFVTMRWS